MRRVVGRPFALIGVIVVGTLLLAVSPPLFASFTAPASIGQSSITSATLQPPTSVSATGGCQVVILGPQITLNWTATTSSFATSYDILRSQTNGGPYTRIASVAGGTTTYTDTTVSGLNATYYYVLQAKYLNWSSVISNQATGTTPLTCL